MSDHTRAITDKCEQYWNEPDIGVPEIHAVLEYIYTKANDAADEIERLRDKAIRYDLDQAGTARREQEAVELVELRAEAKRLRGENQTIIGKAYEQAEMDRDRIEELEEQVRQWSAHYWRTFVNSLPEVGQHAITEERIDKAWEGESDD